MSKRTAAAALLAAQDANRAVETELELLRAEALATTETKLGPRPPRGNPDRKVWRASYLRTTTVLGEHEVFARKLVARDNLIAAFRAMLEAFADTPERKATLAEMSDLWGSVGAPRIKLIEIAMAA